MGGYFRKILHLKQSLDLLKCCEGVCGKQDIQETFKMYTHVTHLGDKYLSTREVQGTYSEEAIGQAGEEEGVAGGAGRPVQGKGFDSAQEVRINIVSNNKALSKDRIIKFVF